MICDHTHALEGNTLVAAGCHGEQYKHNTCFSFYIGGLLNTGPGTHGGDGSDDDGEYLILQ